jgi:hypothetical protein
MNCLPDIVRPGAAVYDSRSEKPLIQLQQQCDQKATGDSHSLTEKFVRRVAEIPGDLSDIVLPTIALGCPFAGKIVA